MLRDCFGNSALHGHLWTWRITDVTLLMQCMLAEYESCQDSHRLYVVRQQRIVRQHACTLLRAACHAAHTGILNTWCCLL
jgi:hypothetical protein